MFDEATRKAASENTIGFGDAFAGRGESINTAIGAFRPLLRDIVPVAQNLAAPETGLRRFFVAIGRTAAIVAPAASTPAPEATPQATPAPAATLAPQTPSKTDTLLDYLFGGDE